MFVEIKVLSCVSEVGVVKKEKKEERNTHTRGASNGRCPNDLRVRSREGSKEEH